ncbi:hypothetical protein B4Q04_14605 [Zobellia sp. OII3]|uniref:hypothetical protein n=1 Tax=Zobellia sp. OII3 TaxID=2034520 RepID=UPI000B52D6DE|nr:hypothetical protein [Zobellia sp. OII3]OWW24545.1 hypothetical protein B4Q04_14605 [Zobellia sp. OII3]
MMDWLNSKKPVKLMLVLVICFFSFKYFQSIYHFKYYARYTIGKFTHFKHQNASTYAMYEFYVDNKKIEGATYAREKIDKFLVNKYFKVKYSSKNPEINEILLDEMITDPKAVEAARFKLKSKIE